MLAEAMRSQAVGVLSIDDLNDLVNRIITLLGIRVGDNPAEKKAHEDRIFDMAAYLRSDHRRSPSDEIMLAYRLLVKGELGIEPIRLLDPIEFGKVMKAYRAFRDQHLHAVIANAQLNALPEAQGPTEAETQTMLFQAFSNAFRQALDGKPVEDFGNAVYDWLDSLKMIPFTPERKWKFFAQAKAEVATYVKRQERDSTKSTLERRKAKRIGELFDEGGPNDVPNDDLKRTIIVRSKLLALRQLIADLIEQNVSIDDFLSE